MKPMASTLAEVYKNVSRCNSCGTLKSNITMEEIPLPAYWGKLVSDYTVQLTPHGNYNVWLVEKHKNMFEIKTNWDAIDGPWSCEWTVIGRRNDYPLEVEQ